jgi:ketosteroid isomerase-like protein
MDERDEFLQWFGTTWQAAETALYRGDAAPRSETWSSREPVTLFGASLSASGADQVRDVFRRLGESFSDLTSITVELIAAEVHGDLAYTAHRELFSLSVNGRPGDHALRVTQVYRRDDGEWKVVHRHGDEERPAAATP